VSARSSALGEDFLQAPGVGLASISDAAVVLRGGQVVEDGPTGEVLSNPKDPYTQSLVAAST
jgi:peptide/nickel transport system ATP-binding protein